MTNLSYTTMFAAINCPHTYLNKMMGLKTASNKYMEEGKVAHRIIQEHVSGTKEHVLLSDLPKFAIVETEDFDPKTKVTLPINDKYAFHGYLDGLDPEKKVMLEIKTGGAWSMAKFAGLAQWKLYHMALPEYKEIYLVNTPRNETEWTRDNIKVFSMALTPQHIQEAENFIKSAIDVIENIRSHDLHFEGRNRYCYYPECSYCTEPLRV